MSLRQEGERTRLYSVTVNTIPRPTINDPSGLAVSNALHELGFTGVESVRIGRHLEFQLRASNRREALRVSQAIARTPEFSNPIMDDVRIVVVHVRARKRTPETT